MNNKNVNKEGKYKKDPINVSKNANMSLYFPRIKDMNKLKITNVGIYSITKPYDAEWISQKIIENVKDPSKLVITDATASVGGNVINFANKFKFVNAIEMNKIHYDVLKNNIDVYKLKNVKIILGDAIREIPKIRQDIIFIDAPWTGTSYKKHKTIRLFMSGLSLPKITNELRKYARTIVLKVPTNFDFNNFFNVVDNEKYLIYKSLKFRLIII